VLLCLALFGLLGAGVGIATAAGGGSQQRATRHATAPTWDAVAPVFAEKCVSCHRSGGIAPFSLTSAQSARRHAQAIALMTKLRVMPPWMPGGDSPAYQGQSHPALGGRRREARPRS
jgi:hypothetical protein